MLSRWESFVSGAKATLPLLLGVVPFGLICGAVCSEAGIPVLGAIGMSLVIFAGASQLVVTQLLAEQASTLVVVMTALVINARLLMYSASLAVQFRGASARWKAVLAYMLTDQAYAVSIGRYLRSDLPPVNKTFYYFGSALVMWSSFNIATPIGAYLGAVIPAGWNLDFAVPLTFIALVVPAIKDRFAFAAAVGGGAIAFLASGLPFNLGLMTAAISGIGIARLWEISSEARHG